VAALLYGFVVDFRVFPIIDALSFFLSLAPNTTNTANPSATQKPQSDGSSAQEQHEKSSQKLTPAPASEGLFGWISLQGVVFGALSGLDFLPPHGALLQNVWDGVPP